MIIVKLLPMKWILLMKKARLLNMEIKESLQNIDHYKKAITDIDISSAGKYRSVFYKNTIQCWSEEKYGRNIDESKKSIQKIWWKWQISTFT